MRFYINPIIIEKVDTLEKFVPLHIRGDIIVVDKIKKILPFVFMSILENPLSASRNIFHLRG